MKKVFALCGALLLLLPTLGLADTLTVQVKKAPLRSEPSFLGKVVANANHNSAVEVIEDQGDWKLVTYKGKQGWMHSSALMTTQSKLNAGLGVLESTVSSKEVSLAGKGFDKEIEKAYRKSHSEANYAAVDKMEKTNNIPLSELKKFKAEGDFSGISR
jgi:uncharacterized protein YgiM (DUF1202 family)